MWEVIVEWDGRKKSTTTQNRLHALGLRVRDDDADDRTVTVLKRRMMLHGAREGAVVLQEGVYLVSSEKLARLVAAYCFEDVDKNGNPPNISITEVETHDFIASDEDKRIHYIVEQILGKRGRPSANAKINWTILCLEEMMTFRSDEETVAVINCPHCGSPLIKAFAGEPKTYAFPSGNVFEAWKRHRFALGSYSVPDEGPNIPPEEVKFTDEREHDLVGIMEKSAEFQTALTKLPVYSAKRMLDGIFASRLYIDEKRREDARTEACLTLLKNNVAAEKVSAMLTESSTQVDILDSASVLGVENAAKLYLSIR